MKFEESLPHLREGSIIYVRDGGDQTFFYTWGGSCYSYYILVNPQDHKEEIVYTPVDFDYMKVLKGEWGVVDQEIENKHMKLGLRR